MTFHADRYSSPVVESDHALRGAHGLLPVGRAGGSASESARQAGVMFDGDDAGRKTAADIADRLVRKVWVRPQGKQPDQLAADEIRELLQVL